MAEGQPAETVFWINVVPLNRREKIARWWVDEVRQQQTYTSKRQREQEFETRIPVDTIDQLASDGLRRALLDQKSNIEEDDGFLTIPRATPDGQQYFGSVGIPRGRPLGVTFTEHGIATPHSDEDH